MGYTTDFKGAFTVTPAPAKEFKDYINKFNRTRHMKRDELKLISNKPDWKDYCFEGNLGKECEYYVADDDIGRIVYDEASIINHNYPPDTMPGLWCQWIINDKNELVWDKGEKFYNYVEWLEYLVKNFFAPKNYLLNGEVYWYGEDFGDVGCIKVEDNIITVNYGETIPRKL